MLHSLSIKPNFDKLTTLFDTLTLPPTYVLFRSSQIIHRKNELIYITCTEWNIYAYDLMKWTDPLKCLSMQILTSSCRILSSRSSMSARSVSSICSCACNWSICSRLRASSTNRVSSDVSASYSTATLWITMVCDIGH